MSERARRFALEPMAEGDNAAVREILEQESFNGWVALRYSRGPEPLASFRSEGGQTAIVVARDLVRDTVVGFGAVAVRNLFVAGRPERVGYLFGMRVRPEYRTRFPRIREGYRSLMSQFGPPRFHLTTILEDNGHAVRLLERRHRGMPVYKGLGRYEVFALVPRKQICGRPRSVRGGFWFRRAVACDGAVITEFLRREGARYNFYPVVDQKTLEQGNGYLPGPHDFCLLGKGSEILGVGALWDQRQTKRYIVTDYRRSVSLVRPLSRIFPLFGYPRLPPAGAELRFCTLSFWAVREGDPDLFRRFLDGFSREAADYPHYVVGLHESDPLSAVIRKRPHLTYRSRLYVVQWKDDFDLDRRTPYMECGML